MPSNFKSAFADQASGILEAILEQSPDRILLLDLDGSIQFINAAGLEHLGASGFASVANTSWAETWPQTEQAQAQQAIDRARRGQPARFETGGHGNAQDSQRWDVCVSPITDEHGALTHIMVHSRKVSQNVPARRPDGQPRETAESDAEQWDCAARETRHRLKNLIAVAGSVAKLLSRGANNAGDLVDRLEVRFQALARAQDFLTIGRAEPPTVERAVLQVFEATGTRERIRVGELPEARLGDNSIQQLALILNELLNNSLKYGALSGQEGQIVLTGSQSGREISLHWHEDTGREIEPPTGSGAGFALLVRLGSTPQSRAAVRWHERGPAIDFHLIGLN